LIKKNVSTLTNSVHLTVKRCKNRAAWHSQRVIQPANRIKLRATATPKPRYYNDTRSSRADGNFSTGANNTDFLEAVKLIQSLPLTPEEKPPFGVICARVIAYLHPTAYWLSFSGWSIDIPIDILLSLICPCLCSFPFFFF
jgi:hypothetical protein